jgi:NAD(P)-dependent dehydrogenase (short-subunit alcohol dehydrogenase family)
MTRAVALITGAGSGIGQACAVGLARGGYAVALLDLDRQATAETAGRLNGALLHTAIADVRDRVAVDDAVDAVMRQWGQIDVLVNAAGTIQVTPFLSMTEDEWDTVVGVNLKGTFVVGQAVARPMAERGSGRIINIASAAGKAGRPLTAHYCASKAGVIGLTQSMAHELAPAITVNAVCPGVIDTPMWTRIDAQMTALNGKPQGQALKARISDIPLARAGAAAEVADLVCFLASDAARYITGQAIDICGGLVMT